MEGPRDRCARGLPKEGPLEFDSRELLLGPCDLTQPSSRPKRQPQLPQPLAIGNSRAIRA